MEQSNDGLFLISRLNEAPVVSEEAHKNVTFERRRTSKQLGHESDATSKREVCQRPTARLGPVFGRSLMESS